MLNVILILHSSKCGHLFAALGGSERCGAVWRRDVKTLSDGYGKQNTNRPFRSQACASVCFPSQTEQLSRGRGRVEKVAGRNAAGKCKAGDKSNA